MRDAKPWMLKVRWNAAPKTLKTGVIMYWFHGILETINQYLLEGVNMGTPKTKRTISVDPAKWKKFRMKCLQHDETASSMLGRFVDAISELPNGGKVTLTIGAKPLQQAESHAEKRDKR